MTGCSQPLGSLEGRAPLNLGAISVRDVEVGGRRWGHVCDSLGTKNPPCSGNYCSETRVGM